MSTAALCGNRPEGFGPSSGLHPRLPTTCFLDVIVEPLATWLFGILMLVAFFLRGSGRSNDGRMAWKRRRGTWRERRAAPGARRRSVVSRVLSALYYVLVVALVAMQTLEIARLVVAQLGVGLLPFTYVGIFVALANRVAWRARLARLLNAAFWLLLAAALALKTAAEQSEQMGPERRTSPAQNGPPGRYPSSDQVLDNAVMLGVALVLALLELPGWSALER